MFNYYEKNKFYIVIIIDIVIILKKNMFYLHKINLYFIVGVNQCGRNSGSPSFIIDYFMSEISLTYIYLCWYQCLFAQGSPQTFICHHKKSF